MQVEHRNGRSVAELSCGEKEVHPARAPPAPVIAITSGLRSLVMRPKWSCRLAGHLQRRLRAGRGLVRAKGVPAAGFPLVAAEVPSVAEPSTPPPGRSVAANLLPARERRPLPRARATALASLRSPQGSGSLVMRTLGKGAGMSPHAEPGHAYLSAAAHRHMAEHPADGCPTPCGRLKAPKPRTAEGPAGLPSLRHPSRDAIPGTLGRPFDFPHLVRKSGPVSYLAPISGG